jgi:hypothetical protein
MNQFVGDVQKFQQIFQQAAVPVTIATPTINIQSSLSNVGKNLGLMNQLFSKLKSVFQLSLDTLISSMGSAGRVFLRGIAIGSEVLSFLAGPIGIAIEGVKIAYYVVSAGARFGKWLWDKMVGLGDAMLRDYLQSSGTWSTIGGMRAYRFAFGGLPNNPLLAPGIAQARADISAQQRIALITLGVKETADTADMMIQATLAAAKLLQKQHKGIELEALKNRLSSLFPPDVMIALLHADIKKLEARAVVSMKNKPSLQPSQKAIKAFIDFNLQLKNAGVQIASIIAEKLANPKSNLVKSLKELSETMVSLVKNISEAKVSKDSVDLVTSWIVGLTEWINQGGLNRILEKLKEITISIIKSVTSITKSLNVTYNTPVYMYSGGPGVSGQRTGGGYTSYGHPGAGPLFRPGIGPGSRTGPVFRPGIDPRRRATSVPPGEGGYGAVSKSAQETAAIVADEWRKAGMSEAGVAGVLANIRSESNFDPTLRHADQPRFSGEAHYAHGLYQEGGDEWNNYQAWLNKHYQGADWRDPRLQSRFAAENLKKNYPNAWEGMNKGTKEQAAEIYVRKYLKPAQVYQNQRSAQYRRGVPGTEHYTKGTPAPVGPQKGPSGAPDPSVRGPSPGNNGFSYFEKNPVTGAQTAGAAGISPHFPVSKDVNWKSLDAEYLARLNKAYEDMPPEAKKDFKMISGYRPTTREQARALGMAEHSSQEDIWERSKGGTLFAAAPPGRSRHQQGTATDFERGAGLDWLRTHAGSYGVEHLRGTFDYPHIQINRGDVRRTLSSTVRDTFDGTPTQTTTGGGAAWLAQRRASFNKELQEDPALQKYLAAVIAHEARAGDEATAVAESIMNRAAASGTTLRGVLSGKYASFFGPINRGEVPAQLGDKADPYYQAAIQRALEGSNLIRGSTDQGQINEIKGDYRVLVDREWFGDWGGGRGMVANAAFRDQLNRGFDKAERESPGGDKDVVKGAVPQYIEGSRKFATPLEDLPVAPKEEPKEEPKPEYDIYKHFSPASIYGASLHPTIKPMDDEFFKAHPGMKKGDAYGASDSKNIWIDYDEIKKSGGSVRKTLLHELGHLGASRLGVDVYKDEGKEDEARQRMDDLETIKKLPSLAMHEKSIRTYKKQLELLLKKDEEGNYLPDDKSSPLDRNILGNAKKSEALKKLIDQKAIEILKIKELTGDKAKINVTNHGSSASEKVEKQDNGGSLHEGVKVENHSDNDVKVTEKESVAD